MNKLYLVNVSSRVLYIFKEDLDYIHVLFIQVYLQENLFIYYNIHAPVL